MGHSATDTQRVYQRRGELSGRGSKMFSGFDCGPRRIGIPHLINHSVVYLCVQRDACTAILSGWRLFHGIERQLHRSSATALARKANIVSCDRRTDYGGTIVRITKHARGHGGHSCGGRIQEEGGWLDRSQGSIDRCPRSKTAWLYRGLRWLSTYHRLFAA